MVGWFFPRLFARIGNDNSAAPVLHQSIFRLNRETGMRTGDCAVEATMRNFLAGTVALLLLSGCGANDITNPNQIIFPDTNVSYQAHIRPFFALSCTTSGCHDAPRANNFNIALTSFYEVRQINVVNQPGDTTCNLVKVMYGLGGLHGPDFTSTENQRRGIKQWVKEGAKNN